MFKTRFLSSVVLVILLGGALIMGGISLWCLLLFISIVGQREIYQLIVGDRLFPSKKRSDMMAMCGYVATFALYVSMRFKNDVRDSYFIMIITLLALMAIYVFRYPKYVPMDIIGIFFGFIYVPMMLSTVYMLRETKDRLGLVWLIFIGSWICDTCAYLVGSKIGKHKLAPVLSPKKSIEGAVGGVAGSCIVGVLYGYFYMKYFLHDFDLKRLVFYFLMMFVCSIFSQIGDLTASAFKRHYGIKDYGTLIPGHGGVLDRFDSVIVVAPIVYIMSRFI